MSPSSPQGGARRALLIVNPAARRALRARDEAVEALERERVACDVVLTKAPGHATVLARERASRYDLVFTVGGDGTAIEVISALAEQGPPIGVLPAGTANVLARALGIPMRVGHAVLALLHGSVGRIDLGRLQDGRHFAIGLGVGLDEAIIAGASPLMKKRVGVLAYVWSATKAAMNFQTFRARLTVDGQLFERQAAYVIIANLGSVPFLGYVLRFGEGIVHDDGVLHACVYSPTTLVDAVRLFGRILRGTAQADPAAFYVSGRHFRLETDPPRRAQADGELLDMTPVEITVRPGAARLLIPLRDPSSSRQSGGSSGK